MSTSWNTLSKIFEDLSDIDDGNLNTLANSQGKKIDIRVRLLSKEQAEISGTVSFLRTPQSPYGAAVHLFEKTLNHHGLHFLWERAVTGRGKVDIEAKDYLAKDDFAHAMMGHDRNLSLRDNLFSIKKNYDHRREHGVPPTEREQAFDLASAIIADSAVVKSEDIERMIFKQKPAFSKIFGFRPRDLDL